MFGGIGFMLRRNICCGLHKVDLFGDPAQGQVKRLRVDYLDGEEARSKTVAEKDTIDIKSPEGKKLSIRRAVFGVLGN